MERLESRLCPLPYHVQLRDYLKAEESELWKWFSSAKAKESHAEQSRLELLKSCYRLDPEGHPELNRALLEAKARLQLDIPVTLYQAQNTQQPNAALHHMTGEGHLIFSGPVLTLLNEAELKSLIGHELAHYHLWEMEDGEFQIADRLIRAAASDTRSADSHGQAAHRHQLYTEIFADRGSLQVTGDLHQSVACLVKIATGLQQVSPAAYLQQAEEILGNGGMRTEGVTHPEAFIRAKSLSLWHSGQASADSEIARMIEGSLTLDDLDLLGQSKVSGLVRHMLEQLLHPKWFQTPAALGHARRFFPDFAVAHSVRPPPTPGFPLSDPKLREFLCYVLLDFARIDPELEEIPLAAALELSRRLEIDSEFEKVASKELKMKPKEVRKLKDQASEKLAKAEVSGE